MANFGLYLLIQGGLLAAHYGFKVPMPWWVAWFPSLVVGAFVGLVLIVGIIAIIMSVFT